MLLGASGKVADRVYDEISARGEAKVFIAVRTGVDVKEIRQRHEPPGTERLSEQEQIDRGNAFFAEIKSLYDPIYDRIERRIVALGARNVHRYYAMPMISADVNLDAVRALESMDEVIEVDLQGRSFVDTVSRVGVPPDPIMRIAGIPVSWLVLGGVVLILLLRKRE